MRYLLFIRNMESIYKDIFKINSSFFKEAIFKIYKYRNIYDMI